MPLQQLQRGFVGQLPRLQVHHRVQNAEIRGELSEIASESRLAQLVPMPAIAADEDRQLARAADGAEHHVGRDAPRLHVVQPDVPLPHALGKIVEHGETGHPLRLQLGNGIGDLDVVDGRGRQRIATVGQASQQARDVAGALRGREFHRDRAANARRPRHRRLHLARDILPERLPRLGKDKAEPHLRQIREHPLPDQRGGMVADALGGLVDAACGFLAHLGPSVQHAVHGGDADPGLSGQVCDGRTLGHVMS